MVLISEKPNDSFFESVYEEIYDAISNTNEYIAATVDGRAKKEKGNGAENGPIFALGVLLEPRGDMDERKDAIEERDMPESSTPAAMTTKKSAGNRSRKTHLDQINNFDKYAETRRTKPTPREVRIRKKFNYLPISSGNESQASNSIAEDAEADALFPSNKRHVWVAKESGWVKSNETKITPSKELKKQLDSTIVGASSEKAFPSIESIEKTSSAFNASQQRDSSTSPTALKNKRVPNEELNHQTDQPASKELGLDWSMVSAKEDPLEEKAKETVLIAKQLAQELLSDETPKPGNDVSKVAKSIKGTVKSTIDIVNSLVLGLCGPSIQAQRAHQLSGEEEAQDYPTMNSDAMEEARCDEETVEASNTTPDLSATPSMNTITTIDEKNTTTENATTREIKSGGATQEGCEVPMEDFVSMFPTEEHELPLEDFEPKSVEKYDSGTKVPPKDIKAKKGLMKRIFGKKNKRK